MSAIPVNALACPGCGTLLQVAPGLRGRCGRCRSCHTRFAISMDGASLARLPERGRGVLLLAGVVLGLALLAAGIWWTAGRPESDASSEPVAAGKPLVPEGPPADLARKSTKDDPAVQLAPDPTHFVPFTVQKEKKDKKPKGKDKKPKVKAGADWFLDCDAGLAEARRTGKPVFVVFRCEH